MALSAAESRRLQQAGTALRARIGIDAATPPDVVLRCLTDEVRALQSKFAQLETEMQSDRLTEIGAVYGELIHDHFGWEWSSLEQPGGYRHHGVVAPNQTHALFLAPYLRRQIEEASHQRWHFSST